MGIAQVVERSAQHQPEDLLVVDRQDPGRRSGPGRDRRRLHLRRPLAGERNRHFEAGAAVFAAVDGDGSAVLLHDAVAQRQAQSGAVAGLLGGEERVEDARAQRVGNARPRVLDPEVDAVRRCTGADRQPLVAAVGLERLQGVGQQVEEHLLQLQRVGANRRKVAVELPHHFDVGQAELFGHERHRVVDRAERVARPRAEVAPAREAAHVVDDAGHPRDLLGDQVEILFELADRLFGLAAHHADEHANRRQRLVQLVGNAGAELTHRGQPSRLQELRLGLLDRGDVTDDPESADDLAAGVAHRRVVGFEEPFASGRRDDVRPIARDRVATGEGLVEIPVLADLDEEREQLERQAAHDFVGAKPGDVLHRRIPNRVAALAIERKDPIHAAVDQVLEQPLVIPRGDHRSPPLLQTSTQVAMPNLPNLRTVRQLS